MKQLEAHAQPAIVTDPPIAQFLFGDLRLAWLWLPLRVWLGWQWLSHGWEKFQNPAWVSTGTALQGFWQRAVVTDPKPVAAYDWYAGFLQFLLNAEAYTWFAKLITFGEIAVGIALILGAFTGVAAFSAGLLNWNFLMAGTASTNGLMFAIATWIVLAWKTAGWIGLDRWLFRVLGTPWRPGFIFHRGKTEEVQEETQVAPQVA
jgi:thiosulfate dehydrogenase [quinone] large subunit